MRGIEAIASELEISRECAQYGNYDEALVYFEAILTAINLHIKQLTDDPAEKTKWTRQAIMLLIYQCKKVPPGRIHHRKRNQRRIIII
jgi:hypothetical protein